MRTGWMVQYADESGNWHDYQWTDNPDEERRMVRHLSRNGNKTRTVIRGLVDDDPDGERAIDAAIAAHDEYLSERGD